MTVTVAAFLVGAYLVGSIPFGVLIGRGLFGVDPRAVGSGNIGAANALRALGKAGAALVLLADVLKGIVPAAVVLLYFRQPPVVVAGVGLATVLGHNWPVFLRFKGGKGVATGLGVLVVLSWQATLVFILVWLISVLATRFASLGSMVANLTVPIVLFAQGKPAAYVAYGVIALALVLLRHATNIRRLFARTELRLGESNPVAFERRPEAAVAPERSSGIERAERSSADDQDQR